MEGVGRHSSHEGVVRTEVVLLLRLLIRERRRVLLLDEPPSLAAVWLIAGVVDPLGSAVIWMVMLLGLLIVVVETHI